MGKGSGGPVIASRGEAIQLLFWIATGLKPLAMTVCPLSGASPSPFFDRGLDWLYLILNRRVLDQSPKINTEI